MRKLLLAGTAVLLLAGSSVVYAQHFHGSHFNMRVSPDDMSAFADARIAGVKAGLRLTADQEKLWPPVEAAVRDLAKLRIDRITARRERAPSEDLMTRLRERSDAMSANAAAFKKAVDAAEPLYKTLNDDQKRRLAMLTHMGGRFDEWRQRWNHWRDGGGRDRQFDRHGGGGMNRMDDRMPDRGGADGPAGRL